MKLRPTRRALFFAAVAFLVLAGPLSVALWRLFPSLVTLLSSDTTKATGTSPEPIEPLEGPWIVALQPGHWRIEDLPDELSHRRGDTGAVYGDVREADINRAVAEALVPKLEAEGWRVVMVPATVPPDLRADVFLSIHADGSERPDRRGWKLSPPWRPSAAARSLTDSLRRSFSAEPGLVEDRDGVTIYMRGYFGFNYRRYLHAISPYTPASLIELGFVTNPQDRRLLTGDLDFWAGIVMRGLKDYFSDRKREYVEDLRPMDLRWVAAGPDGAILRRKPNETAEAVLSVDAGTVLIPVDRSGEWYEVFLRHYRRTVWVTENEVVVVSDRRPTAPRQPAANLRAAVELSLLHRHVLHDTPVRHVTKAGLMGYLPERRPSSNMAEMFSGETSGCRL